MAEEANVPIPAFCLNPYQSIIDLTTTQGQKMWIKATAGSKEKFSLNTDLSNSENFKQVSSCVG